MTPAEVMLSESQERMLVVVRSGAEDRVRQRFARWELEADAVGRITADGLVRVLDGSLTVAELPAAFLSRGAPEFGGLPENDGAALPSHDEDVETLLGPAPEDLGAVLLQLLRSPNLCSRRPVFEQYDFMVQTNTVVAPGEGAAVLRVKGTTKGLALGIGSAPRICSKDPKTGGAMVVAEATRNVACTGARPIALTDCLNFGDPVSPRVWKALAGVVEGIREASLALDVPIISGNVSLYNETEGQPILPTPVVGALGLISDVRSVARASFAENQVVWLLGPLAASLPTSEYARVVFGTMDGSPSQINLDLERRVQACIQDIIGSGAVRSCTDLSDGGLVCALGEMALAGSVGVDCQEPWVTRLESGASGRPDAMLFGEASSRIIFGSAPDKVAEIESAASRWGVPVERLGVTGGDRIRIGKLLSVSLAEARAAWGASLDQLLGSREGV
jgi:phosphoribosylformylglycinamidine synthase